MKRSSQSAAGGAARVLLQDVDQHPLEDASDGYLILQSEGKATARMHSKSGRHGPTRRQHIGEKRSYSRTAYTSSPLQRWSST